MMGLMPWQTPESTMDKARVNLPLILVFGIPLALSSVYLLLQAKPILAIFPPVLIPILLWLGRRPRHGLYLILIMIPFNAWRELISQYRFLTLSKFIGLFLVGILIMQLANDPRRIRRAYSKCWLLLIGFSLVAVVSTFYSDFRGESIDNLRMLVSAYLFLGLVHFFVGPRELQQAIPRIVALSTVVAALIAVAGYLFKIDALLLTSDPSITSGRVLGSASNPNLMAATVLVGIPFIVYYLFESDNLFGRLFWTTLFLISSGAIVLSYSRSMLLVYGILMAILCLDHARRFNVRHTGFASVVIALVLIYGAVKIPETTIWERITTLSAPQTDTSLQRRASYVVVAKDAVKQNPVIGTGPGTFPFIYERSIFASAFAEDATGYARSAHNTYLEVVVGTGVLGLLIFIAAIIYAFGDLYRAHRRFKRDHPRTAALIRSTAWAFMAFLMALLFASQLYHKYVWLFIGLATAANRISLSLKDQGSQKAIP